MRMSRFALIVPVVVVLLQSGCANRATHPGATRVELSLTASPGVGSPALPVIVGARADNLGLGPVWHCEGCGCGRGFHFTVLGPDGAEVATSDPNGVGPMCPDHDASLEPGGEVGDRLLFTGTLYVIGSPLTPSPSYPAPAGLYTVLARFGYSIDRSQPQLQVERSTSFTWQP